MSKDGKVSMVTVREFFNMEKAKPGRRSELDVLLGNETPKPLTTLQVRFLTHVYQALQQKPIEKWTTEQRKKLMELFSSKGLEIKITKDNKITVSVK